MGCDGMLWGGVLWGGLNFVGRGVVVCDGMDMCYVGGVL